MGGAFLGQRGDARERGSIETMIRADLTNLLITRSADEIPTDEVARDQFHTLMVSSSMGETGFRFSSRLAMYDFARSLLHESIYGRSGLKEFYPLEEFDGRRLAIDGVRLSAGSGRVFITYLTDRAYDISPSINI
ncbi:MAG: hypothetical protein LBL69_02660, partial [Zoogloeaceae bacterium]|nr:hypothetical protein [Zoogloeaceae bacterium]